jgi:AcrR family transcriptional regulator
VIYVVIDMKRPIEPPQKARGRPRAFDRDAALDAAMTVFWSKGFDGATNADLLAAMNIRSPSLYAAFGSKADLFAEAVTHYQDVSGGYIAKALAQAPTRKAITDLLRGAARHFTRPDRPAGCLVVTSSLACPPTTGPSAIGALLRAQRRGLQGTIQHRIEEGLRQGDVPASADPVALARYVVLVFEGLALAARQGGSRAELIDHVDRAMAGWPSLA